MIDLLIESPMPIPPGLVVKNASNRRGIWSGSNPTPASCTATRTESDEYSCDRIISSRGRSLTPSLASMPFISRLRMTCCNWTLSPSIGGSAGASSVRSETPCLRASPWTSAATSSATSLMSSDVLYDAEDELRDPVRAGDQRAADVHPDRLAVLPAVPLHKLERRALARDELRDEVDIVFAIVFVGHHPE